MVAITQIAEGAMMRTITMTAGGRTTIPVEARRALGIEGEEVQLAVEVDEERHALVLVATFTIPREDAWAYTDKHRRQMKRALADSAAGRVRQMSEGDLRALAPCD